eukprot:112946_1
MVKFSLYENPSGARPPGLSRSAKLSCCASSSQSLVFEEAEAEISSLKDLKFLFEGAGTAFNHGDDEVNGDLNVIAFVRHFQGRQWQFPTLSILPLSRNERTLSHPD